MASGLGSQLIRVLGAGLSGPDGRPILSGGATMPHQATEVVYALLDAWNRRDLPPFLSLLTDRVEWHDLGMPDPPARGREAVRSFSEAVLRASC